MKTGKTSIISVSGEGTARSAYLQHELKIYPFSWQRERGGGGGDRQRQTDTERERKRSRVADEAWEKTISQMRAQIERQPLTTSCLGVTAQPHLSVCVPRWTQSKGQWLPEQPLVCVVCFRECTHCCVVSLPVFVCVPMRMSCLLSVSKLALSLRQIRWVNNCPSLPVPGVLASLQADKCLHQMFTSIRPRALGHTIQASPRLQLQPRPETGKA